MTDRNVSYAIVAVQQAGLIGCMIARPDLSWVAIPWLVVGWLAAAAIYRGHI